MVSTALNPVLAVAVMLIAAFIGGYIAKWLRMPRIVGYILVGAGIHQASGAIYPAEPVWMSSLGSLVNELALGLILFTIGQVFELRRLKHTRETLFRLSAWEMSLTGMLTAVGCGLAAWALPGMTLPLSLTVGVLLGIAAIATAPAATLLVLREYAAKGPTTTHLLGLVGINNLVSIIGFSIAFIICVSLGWIESPLISPASLWLDLLWVSLGSVVIGGLLGMLLSWLHARVPLPEMVLFFFAVIFLLITGDDWMRYKTGMAFNSMAACLVLGAVFANFALNPSRFEGLLDTIGMPVYALFFVFAGYNLHFGELGQLGVLGVTYVVMRSVGKYLGMQQGIHRMGRAHMLEEKAGLGLLCQAGVAIGLGSYLVAHWQHPLAEQINTVILASVVLYELTGPFLVRYTVIQAGEVKLVTLLRPGAMHEDELTLGKRAAQRIKALLGGGRGRARKSDALCARHVMRGNVRFLSTKAELDDIMHFVEESHLNHFPVVDKRGNYKGMIHFHNLRDIVYDPTLAHLVDAMDLLDTSTPAVTQDAAADKLLNLFHHLNIGVLPVVASTRSKRLIGIVEQRDLLRAMYQSRQDDSG